MGTHLDSSAPSGGATGSGAMPLNRPEPPGPAHDGDMTEAARVAVGDRDDPDLMVDTEMHHPLVTDQERLLNMNRQAESGKRKKQTDLFEKTKRRIRMKTPFGPSLRAFGSFFDDKAVDWDQLDWDKFDLSAYAATELAEDISIPVGTEFIEVAFEAADGEALGKIVRQPERYVSKALKKGRTEASVKHMTSEQKVLMKAAKLVEVRDWIANEVLERLPPHLKPKPDYLFLDIKTPDSENEASEKHDLPARRNEG